MKPVFSGKQIAPEVYTAEYLLNCVEGFEDFKRGDLSYVKNKEFQLLDIRPGLKVLDVGFGRGDFLFHCAQVGAEVHGVDYSAEAYQIATQCLKDFPSADLRLADARELPFPDNYFDRISAGDVVEHLSRPDAILAVREMKRVLKPGGQLLIHTTPNTFFTNYVYFIIKPILKLVNREAVRSVDYHMKLRPHYHLDEHNLFSLKSLGRHSGLESFNAWVDPDIMRSGVHCLTKEFSHNPLGKVLNYLGRFWLVRLFFGNDLFLNYFKPINQKN